MTKYTPILPEIRIEHWAYQDLWSERELEELCCGLEPGHGRPNQDELDKANQLIKDAVEAGALRSVEHDNVSIAEKLYGGARYFYPIDAVTWVDKKKSDYFPNFPKEIIEMLRAPNAEVACAEASSNDKKSEIRIKNWANKDGWRLYELRDLCCGLEPGNESPHVSELRKIEKKKRILPEKAHGKIEEKEIEIMEIISLEAKARGELQEIEEQIRRAAFIKILPYIGDASPSEILQQGGLDPLFNPIKAAHWVSKNLCRFQKFPKALLEKLPTSEESLASDQVTRSIVDDKKLPEPPIIDGGKKEDKFQVFRDMKLMPTEVRFVFISNDYMEVSARGKTKQFHLVEMLLFDTKSKKINTRGMMLQRQAQGKSIETTNKNVKHISDIRTLIFRDLLKITNDPFSHKKLNWRPHFTVDEELDRAGEREKERVLRQKCKGGEIIDPGDPDRGKEDEASRWLGGHS